MAGVRGSCGSHVGASCMWSWGQAVGWWEPQEAVWERCGVAARTGTVGEEATLGQMGVGCASALRN